MPLRRIASNFLWTPEGLLAHPLVEADAAGRILAVGRCADPDRLAGTEFYAGILLPVSDDVGSDPRLCVCGAGSLHPACERPDDSVRPGCAAAPEVSAGGGSAPFREVRLSAGPVDALLADATPGCRATVVIDRALSARDADRIAAHFADSVRWCLSFRLDEALFCEMAGLALRCGGPVCVGDGSPADATRLARLTLVQQRTGLPLHELLGWIAARATGDSACALQAGCRCGLSVLSGLDYERMRLTDRSLLRRIL